ncbi:hypothetical protein ANANG_G00141170 [Anguilla anguilla]|uniref:Uncharacterized protein n=1 Tax=Anguilla anguilla TaxID=7936 RepID=A0A9D3MCG3_ANGAN|nr:hypothetical protein ANANG_G00141170 [Anguilla anguilla]
MLKCIFFAVQVTKYFPRLNFVKQKRHVLCRVLEYSVTLEKNLQSSNLTIEMGETAGLGAFGQCGALKSRLSSPPLRQVPGATPPSP